MQTFYLILLEILTIFDGRRKMVSFYLKTLDVRCLNSLLSIVDVQLNVLHNVDVLNMKLVPLIPALVKEAVTIYENKKLLQNIRSLWTWIWLCCIICN